MTTPLPAHIADMFDLPPESPDSAEASAMAAAAAEAAEAALAAEIAATIESGDVAGDAPDSRTDPRVKVAWPARMQLPDGQVIELQVRDISERGVGLLSGEGIPAYTVVNFEIAVPPLDEGGQITPVKGLIKTTYTVAHGSAILCGGSWQAPPADIELVKMWIKGLRR